MGDEVSRPERLTQLRGSIDNLDAAIVHLLAERFKCTQEGGMLKARAGMPPADPQREAEQIQRLRQLAQDASLDPVSVPGDWTEATGRQVGYALLRYSDRPTAIVAANDLSAVGVLTAADELGIRVPHDLSVVGYDNTVFAKLDRLSLTTIDSHIAEVGQLAGRTLTARLAGDTGTAGTRLLSPALVVRSSTGPPPAP